MKTFFSLVLFCVLTVSVCAQLPPIGIIDYYGLRAVSRQTAQTALQIAEGDEISESKIIAARKRLESISGIEQAQISITCCADGRTILYVGIREKSTSTMSFRRAPTGAIRLPGEIIKVGEEFSAAHEAAILAGEADEDTSAGHSLMKNLQARTAQERFMVIARENTPLLRRVLRESADAEHRALAVQIIAYSDDKRRITVDLVRAMRDANSIVRNNAMRALSLIAELARNDPAKKIKVPFTPFIEMLNSIEWTDRNKSSLALLRLTDKPSGKLYAELKRKALLSLIEMTRWKSSGHSIAPFIILMRISKFSDTEIQKALKSSDREKLTETILKNNESNNRR